MKQKFKYIKLNNQHKKNGKNRKFNKTNRLFILTKTRVKLKKYHNQVK